MSVAKLLRGLLVAITMLVVLAAAGEIALRIGGRLRTGAWPHSRAAVFFAKIESLGAIYRRHAYLNTAPREGSRIDVFGKTVELNSLGHRSPERPFVKPAGMRRVLIAGGSTSFDILAPSNQATWPYLLERALSRADVEIWNAGFPGWTSLESLIAFALRDRDIAPDVVLLYHGINDLQPAAHVPFDRQYEQGHAELTRRALGFDLRPPRLHERSLLLEWVGDRLRGGPGNEWKALEGGGAGPRRARVEDAALETFARNLRSAVALARDAGARPVLATQPLRLRAAQREADLHYLEGWYPRLDPLAAAPELERLNEVTRAVGAASGVEVLDLSRDVAWDDADFADPLHYSQAGRAKIVAFLAPRLGATLRP